MSTNDTDQATAAKIVISSSAPRNILLAFVNANITQAATIRGSSDIDVQVFGSGRNREIFRQDVGSGSWEVEAQYLVGGEWRNCRMRKNGDFWGGQAVEADDSGSAGDGDFDDLIVTVLPYSLFEGKPVETVLAEIFEEPEAGVGDQAAES